MIPKIGKTYNCFDDGKIRESRRYETICCKCFGLTIVKEDRLLAKNNLCVRCRVEQEKKNKLRV